MLTMTGPEWVCHGNRAPGWTVILATTDRDASRMLTTLVPCPSTLILNCPLTSSVNTLRGVSGSTRIGGGSACARKGVKPTDTSPRATAAAAVMPQITFLALLIVACMDSSPGFIWTVCSVVSAAGRARPWTFEGPPRVHALLAHVVEHSLRMLRCSVVTSSQTGTA